MATINDYFEQALLSRAAYASGLTKGLTGGGEPGKPSEYAKLLINSGMSEIQAIDFANKYKVIDQYTDPVSGFSGTLFKDTSDPSGKIYMAIRGTEPTSLDDWSTNFGDIGADGIAIEQGIAMYNWYQRLITPKDSTPTQYEYQKETTVVNDQDLEVIETPASLKKMEDVEENSENGGLVGPF